MLHVGERQNNLIHYKPDDKAVHYASEKSISGKDFYLGIEKEKKYSPRSCYNIMEEKSNERHSESFSIRIPIKHAAGNVVQYDNRIFTRGKKIINECCSNIQRSGDCTCGNNSPNGIFQNEPYCVGNILNFKPLLGQRCHYPIFIFMTILVCVRVIQIIILP